MRRTTSLASLLVWIFITATAFAAEPLVVELWPGKTPGDVGIAGEEKSLVYESPILDGPTKLITNVTKPTITIYSPPATACPTRSKFPTPPANSAYCTN